MPPEISTCAIHKKDWGFLYLSFSLKRIMTQKGMMSSVENKAKQTFFLNMIIPLKQPKEKKRNNQLRFFCLNFIPFRASLVDSRYFSQFCRNISIANFFKFAVISRSTRKKDDKLLAMLVLKCKTSNLNKILP